MSRRLTSCQRLHAHRAESRLSPPPNRHLTSCRSGFTLIELLVVISIIALLVGLLLPALGKAKESAMTAKCLANQHQLGIGFAAYMTNFNQLPGMHASEAWLRASEWGTGQMDGGMAAWSTLGGYNWSPAGPLGTRSWYAGLGYAWPYITSNASLDIGNLDGSAKLFYCPGTTASFEPTSGSIPRGTSFYATWTGTVDGTIPGNDAEMAANWIFGKTAGAYGTATTYYYRGGHYEKDTYLADANAGWGGAGNWTGFGTEVPRPDTIVTHGKPIAACYWRGYSPYPELASKPHGGLLSNTLWNDGSAKSWRLPTHVGQTIVDPYDRAFNAAGYASAARISQAPWWWVLCKRSFDGANLVQ